MEESKFKDVELISDGVTIPCHKLILALHSQYFRTLFLSSIPELDSNQIKIMSFSPQTLNGVKTFIYTRMWFVFLTLLDSRQSPLISLLTPFIIDFWLMCKSFMDRLMDEKWFYLLGFSAVDCSYYTCSSIKVVSAQASQSRTQLRGKQQQQ